MSLGNIAKLCITIGLLAFIGQSVDFASAGATLANADKSLIVLAVGLLFLQLVMLRAVRWKWVVSLIDRPSPYPSFCVLIAISQFFNMVLPSTVGGDGVRMFMLRRLGHPLAVAVHSVILDRALGVMALLLLCFVGLPILALFVPSNIILWGVAAASFAGFVGSILMPWIVRIALSFKLKLFREKLISFVDSADILWGNSKTFFLLMVLSVVGHLILSVAGWLIAVALGVDLPFWPAMAILPAVFLIMVMPISIGGWGVREGGMVVGLALVGISATDALLVSVVYGLLELAVGLLGGVAWLAMRDEETSNLPHRSAASPS